MTIVTLGAAGPLPVDEVWDRYRTVSRWPEWAPQVSRVEADDDTLAFGLEGRVYGRLGVYVDFVVESVDESARRWSWAVRRFPVTLRLEHGVVRRHDRTAAWLRMDGPLPVVVGYAPLARFALHRLVT